MPPGNTAIRNRRAGGNSNSTKTNIMQDESQMLNGTSMAVLKTLNVIVGCTVMLYLAYKWSYFLSQLHDNLYWFTEIKEVEREISFRTEQGLYYSYYKQLTESSSLANGIQDLTRDNLTESAKTINIFYRFNIHQELFLATLYKGLGVTMKPILFYVYFVFGLQGFYFCTMFVLSWILTGTWVSGILTAAFMMSNRHDITRVSFTVSLREHFSLPFIFAQFVVVGRYLGAKTQKHENIYLGSIFFCTLALTITWQFAQFVLLLQALCLFGLAILDLVDKDKVCKVFTSIFVAIVTVWYLQFYQPMVINSLICSIIPTAILLLQSEGTGSPRRLGIVRNLSMVILRIFMLVISATIVNSVFKILLGQDADNHIFRFVKSKLGYEDLTDFETRLYLCLPIFRPLNWDFYVKLSQTGNLPIYAFVTVFEIVSIVLTVFRRWSNKEKEDKEVSVGNMTDKFFDQLDKSDNWRFLVEKWNEPETCYHIGQSLVLAVLAISTLRMKCFWGPYICIISSFGVAHFQIWNTIVSTLGGKGNSLLVNFLRHVTLVFVILALLLSNKKSVEDELDNLQEFYDPDTVDLMEWIVNKTPPDSSFSGSMQLMAGVKLCTKRRITNHPHFEDQELRTRTRELYQYYGKRSPEDVYKALVKYDASYIIMEDSICMSKSPDRCNLPSNMDLSYGHIPDDGIKDPPHLVQSFHPRFCYQVRFGEPNYNKYFMKVFENKTFKIYKVLR